MKIFIFFILLFKKILYVYQNNFFCIEKKNFFFKNFYFINYEKNQENFLKNKKFTNVRKDLVNVFKTIKEKLSTKERGKLFIEIRRKNFFQNFFLKIEYV
ncbi:hypothetical protein [bacterium endosymbiont of Pedicinus badii]|uniref:hypothetical protein n=1 Tax=bacterium endosymbiont of Pedicinus badii TaxID=1719126 RepID=UPI0009BBEDB2|nr:hypothetical protein [bacterium endosymbiont of Pedicinus badii]OQM34370.1 hypothetical protein AOQ89_00560 [bacterium endosymbiont of Pedicinus badii]